VSRLKAVSLLALLGIGLGIVQIIHGNLPATTTAQPIMTFQPPYDAYIAGAGLVEAATGNIAIGTPVSGIVMAISVKVGDTVKAGDILFRIDDRDLQAQRLTAEAQVREAAAALQKPKHKLDYAENLKRHNYAAISAQDLSDLRDDASQAEAALGLARAHLAQLNMEIERRIVRAPVSGEILQLKMRLGEYVEASASSTPLLLMGGGQRLNVRVDVDEYDVSRFRAGAEGVAYVRGHPELKVPLRYEYTEPFMVQKTALTGRSTERTDTRVLQVLYSFNHSSVPFYVGQQLDVYIQASATNENVVRP